MNYEEALKKIADVIGLKFEKEETQSFKDVKAQDGSVLSVDGDIAPGAAIQVKSDSGMIPAPDGEIVLEDGTKLTVQGGLIVNVEAQQPDPNANPAGNMEEQVKGHEARIAALEAALGASQQAHQAATEQADFYKKNYEQAFKDLVAIVQELSGTPAAPPIEEKKHVFSQKRDETIKNLTEVIAKINK